ncbi:hypothetical protein [Corynebacterium sp. 21KM1197]|uniref:hypothetical protein n=1 Tax=Corynebacterium sp. 21KM1197 TaxID=2989734 RepID=UPI0029CA6319|nr:hypothetical protein [Corynebacterium sp. 21KM1197]WPF67680.1 hypothetical protein OLW90_06190 [Corynebacterium sp. 21KM1197]
MEKPMQIENVPVVGMTVNGPTDWTTLAIFGLTFLLFVPPWLAYGNPLKLSKVIRRIILLLGMPAVFAFGIWVLSLTPEDNIDTVDLGEYLNTLDTPYRLENVEEETGGSVVDLPYSGRTKTYAFTFNASPRGEEEQCKGTVWFERKNQRSDRTKNVYASVWAACPSDGDRGRWILQHAP